jgi:hypothetical protein
MVILDQERINFAKSDLSYNQEHGRKSDKGRSGMRKIIIEEAEEISNFL